MPSLTLSVHSPPFDYDHPIYRAAREEALKSARGRCPICLRTVPLEVHHRTVPYPPVAATTPDDLLALCSVCHAIGHYIGFAIETGVSPQHLLAAVSESVASLSRPSDDERRVGRALWFGDGWGWLVSGASRPRSASPAGCSCARGASGGASP